MVIFCDFTVQIGTEAHQQFTKILQSKGLSKSKINKETQEKKVKF